MPYERKGRCVFRKDTGERVGCSKTVEGAKVYLRKLYQVEGKKKEGGKRDEK